jgi:hypothetical protein
MIIDEASKTTFAEFLVPALYARKWIISGDVKQLSPYVDQRPITENIASIRDMSGRWEGDKNICLHVFQASRMDKSYKGRIIVYDEGYPTHKYLRQAMGVMSGGRKGGRNTPPSMLIRIVSQAPTSIQDKLNTLGASIVMVRRDALEGTTEYLSPLLEANVGMSSRFTRRKSYLANNDDDIKLWEEEVAWRLSRQYELRDDTNIRAKYDQDLRALLPYFNSDGWNQPEERHEVVWREIDKIRRIALPSIIELLKCGFKLDRSVNDESNRTPLYEGLPEKVFTARSTMLKYQHRMHPQISAFPRKNVYDSGALIDADDVHDREWSYNEYGNRMVWIDVKPGRGFNSDENYNEKEISRIERELRRFMEWSRGNKPNTASGLWEVAVLTFYKGQEKKIINMLRNLFNRLDGRSFIDEKCHVKVDVCTVDRFQGHEADIVFLSMVRRRSVGFLDNRNRMNVALTRAKHQLVILGDKRTFLRCRSEFLMHLAEQTGEPIIFEGG